MSDNPNAEIIAIGTEILLGEITDTNSVFMARALRDIGVNVYYMTSVGDNLGRIENAIRLALSRAEIVITCGGLGPTVDDMTRQAIANATDRELVFQQELFDMISERFRGFGVTMTENNRQQAYLPTDATVIENPVGTAPSFSVETNLGVVISLPGVPREMKYLMTSAVVPYLLDKYDLGIIVARTLRTAGIGESSLDDLIGKELLSQSNPTVGLAAHHGSVDVRVTAKAETPAEASVMLEQMQVKLEKKIGQHIFGTDEATIEAVVQDLLEQHNSKIVVVEAGLPNAIMSRLNKTHLIKESEIFSNPNEVFKKLEINSASMSLRDFAVQLAEQNFAKGDVVASIVLLSHPDIDENADIEQGSTIAVTSKLGTRHRVYGFGAKSNLAKDWLPRWGLSTLWRMLKEQYNSV